MTELRTLKVALLGCGNVGAQVARILIDDADALAARTGARLELSGIAVRNIDAPRDVELPQELFTTDAETLVKDADLVIELMGGIEPARTLILSAMRNGACVVTGNKALLAQDGPTLYEEADKAGVQLSYEAAVAGAIPILRPIRDSLSGDRITRVLGHRQRHHQLHPGPDGLHRARSSPTPWPRPSASATRKPTPPPTSKATTPPPRPRSLPRCPSTPASPWTTSHCEGITSVTAADIAAAKDAGFVIKLLAIAEKLTAAGTETGDGNTGVSVRVHPTLLPREHPLAAVRGAFNAVFIEAENAGELMFYGQGAGGTPTASAVLGDLVSAARRIVLGGPGRTETTTGHVPALPIDAAVTSYYIGLDVADQPGVLAKIAQLFAEHGVSIEIMRQTIHRDADSNVESAELRIVTHRASEAALAATVEAVKGLDVINSVTSVLRVEGV